MYIALMMKTSYKMEMGSIKIETHIIGYTKTKQIAMRKIKETGNGVLIPIDDNTFCIDRKSEHIDFKICKLTQDEMDKKIYEIENIHKFIARSV